MFVIRTCLLSFPPFLSASSLQLSSTCVCFCYLLPLCGCITAWQHIIKKKLYSPSFRSHLNKTTTYEVPICSQYDTKPPEPRLVVLNRCTKNGFGFVAGSERPVIVRYVTAEGPSVDRVSLTLTLLSLRDANSNRTTDRREKKKPGA